MVDEYKLPLVSIKESNSVTVLSTIALVGGLIGLFTSFIPCLGMLAVFITVPAGAIGIAAVFIANSKKTPKAFALTATTIAVIGFFVSYSQYSAISKAADSIKQAGIAMAENNKRFAEEQRQRLEAAQAATEQRKKQLQEIAESQKKQAEDAKTEYFKDGYEKIINNKILSINDESLNKEIVSAKEKLGTYNSYIENPTADMYFENGRFHVYSDSDISKMQGVARQKYDAFDLARNKDIIEKRKEALITLSNNLSAKLYVLQKNIDDQVMIKSPDLSCSVSKLQINYNKNIITFHDLDSLEKVSKTTDKAVLILGKLTDDKHRFPIFIIFFNKEKPIYTIPIGFSNNIDKPITPSMISNILVKTDSSFNKNGISCL